MTDSLRLVVSDLACQRGDRRLFVDLNFRIGRSEALIVTGPNGVGKTSLLRMVAGLLAVESGRILLEGAAPDLRLAEQLHYLGHKDGLRAALTAFENLSFAAGLFGAANLSPLEALAKVGLPRVADLPVGVLSAGQRRRVALARLLVASRPIWLLDEPTSGLDTTSQAMVAGLIREHMSSGGMVVAATHLSLGVASVRGLRFAADGSHSIVKGEA